MQAHSVLMVTRNDTLWLHWRQIDGAHWLPARGQGLPDMQRWAAQSREFVVLDAALPHLPRWDSAEWATYFRSLKVLVLNTHPSDAEAHQVLSGGASGYAHALTPVPSLNTILLSIQEDSVWLGRSLMQRLLQDVGSRLPPLGPQEWMQGLSPREQEVAQMASMGSGNQQIAERLGITERTVRAHLSAVFEKLQVSDRLMLALKVHGIA